MIEKFKTFLTAFSFANKAFYEIDNVHLLDNTEFPRSPERKYLFEEILPLAIFVKHIEGPEYHLRVKYTGDQTDLKYDAILKFKGKQRRFKSIQKVEIVSAISSYEHLQRLQLATSGTVFLGPNIKKEGSKHKGYTIENSPSARHLNADLDDAKIWVQGAINKKKAKVYPNGSILLVRVALESPLNISQWGDLITWVYENCDPTNFDLVYLIDMFDHQVFSVFKNVSRNDRQ